MIRYASTAEERTEGNTSFEGRQVLRLWLYLVMILLLVAPYAHADRIVLRNGDALTGVVTAYRDGSFEITSTLLGSLKAPWDSVQSITSDRPLSVILPDRTVSTRTIRLSKTTAELAAGNSAISVNRQAVQSVRAASLQADSMALHRGLLEQWSSSFDVGMDAARSDASSTNLNLAMKAVRTTAKDRVSLSATSLYSHQRDADGGEIRTSAARGSMRYDRNIGPKEFAFLFAHFEADELQELDLRKVFGAGIGRCVAATDRTRFDVFTGASFLQESFANHPQRRAGELLFGQMSSFSPTDRIEISETAALFPNLTDTGEHRWTMESTAAVGLNHWLAWEITFTDTNISNPPFYVPGNNLQLSTGFRLRLGKDRKFKPASKVAGL